MGLDISLYVEKKTDAGWRLIYEEGSDPLYADRRWYDKERNSTLFAILGFNTDEYPGLEAIAPMRGVPADLSPELSRYYDEDYNNYASYLTLEELRAFDWHGHRYEDDTYAEIAGNFFTRTLPLIEQHAEGAADTIRVVFFFSI